MKLILITMMYNSTRKDDRDEVLKLSKNASDELG